MDQGKVAAVIAEIKMTNNGKLMIQNLPNGLYETAIEMIMSGMLKRATFLNFGDSIVMVSK